MLVDIQSIQKYIPQRPPFVMIDSLVTADEKGFNSRFQIQSDNLLLTGDLLSESALIENIAQTCAAGFGYLSSLEVVKEAGLGFIGAVTKLEVTDAAKLNDVVETEINILNTFENIHLIEGSAKVNGKEMVRCQMKIVLA